MDAPSSETQANMLNARDKPQKPRHRASVACAACRERRTRCVVPTGQDQCTQCKDVGQRCIIKNDDERRKPNSKAYVNSLRERIAHLETLLEDKESRTAATPTAVQTASVDTDTHVHDADPPPISTETYDFAMTQFPEHELTMPQLPEHDFAIDPHSPANSAYSSTSSNKSTISRLLSTKGHLSFDQLSGRLRWFGPTTNCHVYSELAGESEENNRQAMEQRRRTQRVLSTLPHETQDYLMQMFWQHYNSVIHVIHQGAFEEGMRVGQGQFYSPFLHICVLAMGYRHADKARTDMMKISLPGKESTLHREAKYMLDYELERPGGVPSIQALLLLGDLECGVGRDNLGWLISGMAMRSLFDAGLHLAHQTGMSQLEVEIGRMTLWACVIYDRYWALFLGRPTALKPEDLEVYRLAQQFERLGTLEPAGPSRSLEKQIYEALLDLMELAGKITEIMDKASKPNVRLEKHVYVTCSALSFELETWYSSLPGPLQWNADNINGAPMSYFLLHQQYHAAMILLHRQFAHYDDVVSSPPQSSDTSECSHVSSHFATSSRLACNKSAGRMAQIFWEHRKQHNIKRIFTTGLQHAGTAAIALVAALASPKDAVAYNTNMRYLECLTVAITDMTETYQPAERMSAVLCAVLDELKACRPANAYTSTIPARRSNSTGHESDTATASKRVRAMKPQISQTNGPAAPAPAPVEMMTRRHTSTGMPPPVLASFEDPSTDDTNANNASSSAEGFVAMQTDSGMDGDWNKFDNPNPFSMDDTSFMHNLGRPTSPNPFRSAWMGAETPTFSPMPTGTSASMFTSTLPTSEFAGHDASAPAHDMFTSAANLDFMALLNPHDRNANMRENLDPTIMATSTQDPKTRPFDSLPTPTSQTASTDAAPLNTTSSTLPNTRPSASTTQRKASRSRSRQRPSSSSSSEKPGDRGYSQTMAGLDDIWKEMMRTNKACSATAKAN